MSAATTLCFSLETLKKWYFSTSQHRGPAARFSTDPCGVDGFTRRGRMVHIVFKIVASIERLWVLIRFIIWTAITLRNGPSIDDIRL
jgi:hypothetical protein